jgi:two-component system, OmpR family, alkaline phosphatase synthesis response regulator PhoP
VASARRILIIEDDPKTASVLDLYLRNAGYRTMIAATGDEGLALARSQRPDLVLLDLMLPGMGGLEVCRRVREVSPLPIIMLTARSTEEDKLRGLGLGADDYIAKPFSPREVVARVAAVLRRSGASFSDGDLSLDPESREVVLRGERVVLTAVEFAILEKFLRAPGRVFTRDELLRGEDALDRTVDVHIKNLRRKIEVDRAKPTRIVTVFGVGYKFVAARFVACDGGDE